MACFCGPFALPAFYVAARSTWLGAIPGSLLDNQSVNLNLELEILTCPSKQSPHRFETTGSFWCQSSPNPGMPVDAGRVSALVSTLTLLLRRSCPTKVCASDIRPV